MKENAHHDNIALTKVHFDLNDVSIELRMGKMVPESSTIIICNSTEF